MAQRVANVELEKARAFAKNYVNITEAMLQAGVSEDQARTEARLAALTLLQHSEDTAHRCSVCGHTEK
jgi:hypothetical protein